MLSFCDFQVASDVRPVAAAPAPAPVEVTELDDLSDPGADAERRGYKNEFKLEVIKVYPSIVLQLSPPLLTSFTSTKSTQSSKLCTSSPKSRTEN